MRIYAFTEHYPNPYKPYLDAQFAQWIEDGHELAISPWAASIRW